MQLKEGVAGNDRALAARAVAGVAAGRSLDTALPATADGFTRALAYGVLRERALLEHLLGRMLDQPVTAELQALLLCGIHQLRSMDVAPHAAVNETVSAVELLGQPKARGLVNAVLRRYQRERATLEQALPDDAALRLSHPPWLLRRLQQDWPQQWRQILEANNRQGPLTLRVNQRRMGRDEYLAKLQAAGISAQPVAAAGAALVLDEARKVEEIPGFAEGEVSVQDAAAQLAFDLLQPQDGERVLDACAAPGGKTAHILERVDASVVALDSDAKRLQRVEENLRRLKLSAQLVAADAAHSARWWDQRPFDRILLDAPCSGSGVIRRHPDIKWLRRDSDIARLAQQQLRLLQALWPLLRPGGVLLYAACSTLRAESDDVLEAFTRQHADASVPPMAADWGEATRFGRRIAPAGAFDGFYYARLQKMS